MKNVKAYAAHSAAEPLGPVTIDRRELQPHDVLIEIKYCGVCHSDVNHAKSLWFEETYPIVPGHEITGIVTEVGDKVTRFRPGARVGIGCMVGSCGECDNCRNNEEQYCLRGITLTYGSIDEFGERTAGGYSTHIVAPEAYVLSIPDELPLDTAAPLLCAGITTYWPLRQWGVGPGKRVAVIGIGGLGHLAVKIAHAMGAEVSTLSRSASKGEDSARLGAIAHYATSDENTFAQLANAFDIIINTVSADIPLDKYLALLARGGVFINVAAPVERLDLSAWSLLRNRRILTGSLIGNMKDHQEMLDFCAEHGIESEIETIAMQDINEAYERILVSDVRYRFVIDNSTL